MNQNLLLTFNGGSSTIKVGIFEVSPNGARRRGKGVIHLRHRPLRLHLTYDAVAADVAIRSVSTEDLVSVMDEMFSALAVRINMDNVIAVGHRIVHGGDTYAGPIRVSPDAIIQLESLASLAPLHQLLGVRLIQAVQSISQNLPQYASFDTAFHRTNAEVVRRFAIPRALYTQGIRRYGFHGLSYKYVAKALERCDPATARGKVVIAHLGSGASLCALDGGVSVDTSMGFSTLDGIPMATRCGALDAGVLLHLLGPGGRTVKEVEDMLYNRSGLLGISGLSADSRDLLASDRPEAREALALFTFRIAGEVARMAATLGGLDGIVFTAGIGENQPEIRTAVATRLGWLGLEINPVANAHHAEIVSAASSRVRAFVIPTDEEQVIADETLSAMTRH
jgi:acetate kinase